MLSIEVLGIELYMAEVRDSPVCTVSGLLTVLRRSPPMTGVTEGQKCTMRAPTGPLFDGGSVIKWRSEPLELMHIFKEIIPVFVATLECLSAARVWLSPT